MAFQLTNILRDVREDHGRGRVYLPQEDLQRFGYSEVDYPARKDRKSFAVLVHGGEGSPDPNEPNLRRRLLECDRVFHPDALLVLDLGKGEIHEVSFHFPHERNIDFFFRFLTGLFIVFLVIGIIWVLVSIGLI